MASQPAPGRAPRSRSSRRLRGAAGKQRPATSVDRPRTSNSCPPRYAARVLIPIRARTLRRPSIEGADQVGLGRGRCQGARCRGCPPARGRAPALRRGWTAEAPAARSIATAWMSKASPASASEVGPVPAAGRRQRRMHGPDRQQARDRDPAGPDRRVADRRSGPPRSGRRAGRRATSRSSARRRPPRPARTGHVASRRGDPPAAARRRPTISVKVARARSAADRGRIAGRRAVLPGSSRAGRGPSEIARDITRRSRSGSIGGFVTWANAWRR